MSIDLYLYRRVPEIEKALREFSEGRSEKPLFLVPGSADREFLKDILLDGISFGGEDYLIWRWDDLYRDLAGEIRRRGETPDWRRQIDPPDHWLILRYLVALMRDGESRISLPPGARQGGFLDMLGGSVRELLREEVSPEDLERSLAPEDDGNPDDLSDPARLLWRLYSNYISYLEETSPPLADSAEIGTLTWRLMEAHRPLASAWASRYLFVFVGFSSFTHSQLHLVRKISGFGGRIAVFTPVTGIRDMYGVSVQLEGARLHDVGRRKAFSCLEMAAGDSRLELETVIRQMILWSHGEGVLAGCPSRIFPGWEHIGMNVPSAELALALEVLRRYRVPFSLTRGTVVSDSILWTTATRIWDAFQEGWPVSATANILSQPWLAGSSFPAEMLEREAPRGDSQWRDALRRSGSRETLEAFERIRDFASAIRGGGSPEALLRALGDLARRSPSWPENISRYVRETSSLDEAVRELNAALQEADRKILMIAELQRDVGEAGRAFLRGGEAMAFLSNWASTATTWKAPQSTGTLKLYVDTPPVLAHHEIYIVTGSTAKAWPGSLSESPLLDDGHKRLLHEDGVLELGSSHLPLLAEKRQQRELLFRRLLACGDALTIVSRPLSDSTGRPILPTSFLVSARDDGWLESVDSEHPLLERSLSTILPDMEEPRIEGPEIWEPSPSTYGLFRRRELPERRVQPEISRTLGLSQIDDYAQCPFRFYCLHVLKMREREESGYSDSDGGSAVHQLWSDVWENYIKEGGRHSLPVLVRQFWKSSLRAIYPALIEDPSLERHEALLFQETLRMADIQQEMEEAGLKDSRRQQLRERFLPEWTLGGVTFHGKFDRIDVLDDGMALIFDYKTGRSDRQKKSLQLAAYSLLLDRGTGGVNEDIRAVEGYAYLCQRDAVIVKEVAAERSWSYLGGGGRKEFHLEERMSEAEDLLQAIAGSADSGIYKAEYGCDACRYCSFSGICRKNESGHGDDDDEN